MRWVLQVLFLVCLAAAGAAQERAVRVQLDDGEMVEGTVVAMDLTQLQVRVGEQVRTLDAQRIRHCRFGPFDPPAPEAAPAGASQAPAAAPLAETSLPPAPPSPPAAPAPTAGDDAAAADPDAEVATARELGEGMASPARRAGGLSRELLAARLARLDAAYPWLQPGLPTQWLSLGLLLAVIAGVGVQLSARVAGAEGASLARSFGVAAWYLASGAAQLALVPANDLTVVAMLLLNPALALFLLCGLFGLTRLGASMAFAVQLGFVALGYGVLELVTAVLSATGATGAA